MKVLFLEKRKFKLFKPISWLSNLIYLFQGKYTHTAVTFLKNDKLYVREMKAYGVVFTYFPNYLKKHEGRCIVALNLRFGNEEKYNKYCNENFVKYDYKNLLIWQPIKFLFSIFVGKDTPKARICSEDSARCVNVFCNIIENPEKISPNELFKILNYG